MADSGDLQQYKTIRDIFSNYYTPDEIDKMISDLLQYPSIGGKIFYDAGDNGAIYTFYDRDKNIIRDTSISSLQNAVYYLIEGTPTKDRFYAVYPSMLNSGNRVYWGFFRNVDIRELGGNIVNTGLGIGTGKGNTTSILNYISTYASSEAASTSKPTSDISQSSPNGYNLYKNCGTDYNYLWDILRDANNTSLEGHNDWFIPSKDELNQIGISGVISSITSSNFIWSSSAHVHRNALHAWEWSYKEGSMNYDFRYDRLGCVVCRAF